MKTTLEGSLCWGRFQEIEPGLEEGDRGQASPPWGHQPRGEMEEEDAPPAFCFGGEAPFGGDVSARAWQGRRFGLCQHRNQLPWSSGTCRALSQSTLAGAGGGGKVLQLLQSARLPSLDGFPE